jgi:Na+/H+-translocating membrane pyrophosphatase
MKHIGICILIIAGLVLLPRVFSNIDSIMYSEVWLFLSSLSLGIIFVKLQKIDKQSDILIIGLVVALTLAVPMLFSEQEGNVWLTQTARAISFFIATYIGLVIPLYISSRIKNLTKTRSQ